MMNNIEKFIEQVKKECDKLTFSEIYENYKNGVDDALSVMANVAVSEAFAKAVQQQSEPVCNVEGSWLWIKLMDYCRAKRISPSTVNDLFAIAGEAHKLYTDPPNTVPLEKYNMAIEALNELADHPRWGGDIEAYQRWVNSTASKAIAQAEGK